LIEPDHRVDYQPTADDLIAAAWCATVRVYYVIGIVTALIAVTVFMQDGTDAVVIGLICGGIMAVLGPLVLVPMRLRRVFAEQRSASEVRRITINHDGLASDQRSGSLKLPWGDVLKWNEDGKVLLVYLNRSAFIALPKRVFPSEAVAFARHQLIASGLPKRRRRRP